MARQREMSTNALGDVVPIRRLKFKRTKGIRSERNLGDRRDDAKNAKTKAKFEAESDKENSGSVRTWSNSSNGSKRAPLGEWTRSNSNSNSEATSFQTCNSKTVTVEETAVVSGRRGDHPGARKRASSVEHSLDAFDFIGLEDLEVRGSPGAQLLIGELEEECEFLRSSLDKAVEDKAVGTSQAAPAVHKAVGTPQAAPTANKAVGTVLSGQANEAEAAKIGVMLLLSLMQNTSLGKKLERSEAEVRTAREETLRLESELGRSEVVRKAQEETMQRLDFELERTESEMARREHEAAIRQEEARALTTREEESKDIVVLNTTQWLDFSCQVNTIDTNHNPLCSADGGVYFSSEEEEECSSSSEETDSETALVHATSCTLRLRRQNEALKSTLDSVTTAAKRTKDELLKRNGLLISTIDKQAAENFELVCKHKQSLSKLSVVLEEQERLRRTLGREEIQELKAEKATLKRELQIREQDLGSLREQLMNFVEKLQEQQSKLTQAAADQRSALQEKLEADFKQKLTEQQAKLQTEFDAKMDLMDMRMTDAALAKQESELRAQAQSSLESSLKSQMDSLNAGFTKQLQQALAEKEEAIAALQESLLALEALEKATKNQKEEHADQIRDLEASKELSERELLKIIEELNSALTRQKKELETLATEHETNSIASLREELLSEKKNALSALEETLKQQSKEALEKALGSRASETEAALSSMKEEHASELAALKEKHAGEISQLKEELTRSASEEKSRVIEAATSDAEAKLEEAKAAFEAKAIRDRDSSLEEMKEAMQASFDEKLLALGSKASVADAAISSLKEAHANEIAALRDEHASMMAKLRDELTAAAAEERTRAVEAERSSAETRIGEARDKAEALESMKESMENALTAIEQQSEAFEKTVRSKSEVAESAIATLKQEHEAHVSGLKAEHAEEVSKLKDDLVAVNKANLLMDSQVAKAEVSIKRLQKAVSRLSTENAELCSSIVGMEKKGEPELPQPSREEAAKLEEAEQAAVKQLDLEKVIENLKESLSLEKAKKAVKSKKTAKRKKEARKQQHTTTTASAKSKKGSSWK
ncbi:hypothetical protein A3770_08p51490 [Chloropicon primus]|uniref:Uncharacterized protein n=3 Tax=Chloropicon primus TaxID=1764295 RepID=A0A5B8MQJ7_9CHLO|nr:hypothetical protein A3770_08p51490 [Chloropicon primus]|eukprot:QDZ22631.1 hypothetical protein A3770_08p51490 [Chloropicon primus]